MNRRASARGHPALARAVATAVVLLLPAACRRAGDAPSGQKALPAPAATLPARPTSLRSGPLFAPASFPTLPPASDDDLLPPAADLPLARRAIQVARGAERVVDADRARAAGLTVVDLSDDWAPAVFADGTAPDGTLLPNRYRAVFVGLASDRTDGDGQPLGPGEKNFLELYGIPPTLSVLRERFLADAARACDPTFDVGTLLATDGIETWGAATEQKEQAKQRLRAQRLEAARAAADADTLEALAAADPRYAKEVKAHRRAEAERAAFAEIEKRLACEGFDLRKHGAGRYDSVMRKAMFDFQQKHTVIDQADIKRSTLETLSRPLLANDYAALRRVLAERVADAGGILEDGSASSRPAAAGGPATYLGADGARHPVPDLVGEATDRLMARLELGTPEQALAFFRRHPAADFRALRAAVRLPPLPEYYGGRTGTMDLSAEIDRGDVWYDFPFNDAGVRQPQPRERFPAFTLFVRWRGERLPLVHWRTTVGGWRSELASDGQEYYRYKDSDVGPRVWRHIVAAPVWIPPPSSPLGSMVKEKKVNGAFVRVTNYDETGPGYLSAYGLAAAIHEQALKGPGGVTYFDNGIRTHGSFDYTSLRGRFSHGCHRLYNNLAVRLFSFVLKHRRVRTLGPIALGARRWFYSKGEVFEMRLPSRGFYFELTPPLSVETLEGRIKGTREKPIAGYVRKPGVKYATVAPPAATNNPESKAGGVEAP
ncbi:MAG TPA: L,D-transpeptidase [Polyangia bacterium]|nr:L,D-transpeptidase [Polyangia bacterium]